MNLKTLLIIIAQALLILVLGYVLIIQSIAEKPVLFDEKPYRDSINALKQQNAVLDTKIHTLDSVNAELSHIKTEIIYETHEKIKFVYTANPDTLYKFILSEIK